MITLIMRIDKFMTIHKCVVLLYVFIFGLACPVPDRFNYILDSRGGRVEDYMWYYSYYGVLTLVLYMLNKITCRLSIKLLYLLSWGKLVDQLYNPYGYHLSEAIWDALVILWTLKQIKWREVFYTN